MVAATSTGDWHIILALEAAGLGNGKLLWAGLELQLFAKRMTVSKKKRKKKNASEPGRDRVSAAAP